METNDTAPTVKLDNCAIKETQEVTYKIEEDKRESKVLKFTISAVRIVRSNADGIKEKVSSNWDLIVLFSTLAIIFTCGYFTARVFGVSQQTIESEILEYLKIVGSFITGLLSLIYYLSTQTGTFTEWFKNKTNKPRDEIDDWGQTRIKDNRR